MHSIVALSLAALAAAAPLSGLPSTSGGSQGGNGGNGGNNGGNRGQQRGQAYTANFDDFEADGLLTLLGLDAVQIGQYQGLDYDGFTVVAPLGVAGIQPESDPNVITYGGAVDTALAALGLAPGGAPSISAQYLGSNAASFDFKSFYFGCNVLVAGVGVPQSCEVMVRGYRGGAQVAQQTFDYNAPALAATDDMERATLGRDFMNLDSVRFDTTVSGIAVDGTEATLLDDLSYVVYPANNNNNNNNGYGNNGGYQNKGGEQQYGSQGAEKNSSASHGW